MCRKSRDSPMRYLIGERCGELNIGAVKFYNDGVVGNVRLSHLLVSFLFLCHTSFERGPFALSDYLQFLFLTPELISTCSPYNLLVH